MNRTNPLRLARRTLTVLAFTLTSAAVTQPSVLARADPNAHAAHASHTNAPAAAQGDLAAQVADLQKQVSQLESLLRPKHTAMPKQVQPPISTAGMAAMSGMKPMAGASGTPKPASGMSGMAGGPAAAGMGGMMGMMDKMMGMMDKMMGGMGSSMPAAGSAMGGGAPGGGMAGGMMAMDKMEMAGMMGMGGMGGGAAGGMAQSALPGFPGASHLYHIGATGFFLDHPQHIALSTEQQAALNHAKEQALLAKQSSDRQAEQAEQELWTLTAADQPDSALIDAKIGEIEKLHQNARLVFIRAVGEAAKLLTDEQRKILTGFAPPAPAASAGGMAGGMGDM